MPEDTDRTLSYGEVAYNAYCGARDWKSYDGKPLPRFTDPGMKTEIAVAWELAATEVIMQFRAMAQPTRSVTQVDVGSLPAAEVVENWRKELRVQTSFEA